MKKYSLIALLNTIIPILASEVPLNTVPANITYKNCVASFSLNNKQKPYDPDRIYLPCATASKILKEMEQLPDEDCLHSKILRYLIIGDQYGTDFSSKLKLDKIDVSQAHKILDRVDAGN